MHLIQEYIPISIYMESKISYQVFSIIYCLLSSVLYNLLFAPFSVTNFKTYTKVNVV